MSLISIYRRHDAPSLLYKLLGERDETINVSHAVLPTWEQHLAFIEKRPYAAWYLIECEGKTVGACYLTKQDEIGIFIFKDHQGNGYGPLAIQELIKLHGKRRYAANINPRNEPSARVFSRLGFNLIQHTYELNA